MRKKTQIPNPQSQNDVFFIISHDGRVRVIPRTTRKGLAQRKTKCMKEQFGYLEAISRDCRWSLLNWLRSVYGHWRLAELLKVSRGTLQYWISRKKHPSNENLSRIIDLAIKTDEKYATELLTRDLVTSMIDFMEKMKDRIRNNEEALKLMKKLAEKMMEVIK